MRLRILTRPIGTIAASSSTTSGSGPSTSSETTLPACSWLKDGRKPCRTTMRVELSVRRRATSPTRDLLCWLSTTNPLCNTSPGVADRTRVSRHRCGARQGSDSAASRTMPDLIVLDLDMPVMDGWQFRREQRYLTDRKLAAVPGSVDDRGRGRGDPCRQVTSRRRHQEAIRSRRSAERRFGSDRFVRGSSSDGAAVHTTVEPNPGGRRG